MHTSFVLNRRLACGLGLAAAALLSGCASGPVTYTTQVQSYASTEGLQLPTTYRMELLPSQSQQASFTRIEQAAQQALGRVGMARAPRPEQARWVVQVGASASQGRAYHPAYDDYHYGPRGMFGWGMGFGGPWGPSIGMRWMMDTPPMVYYRAVKLVIRDQHSQRIVYESSAEYDEVRMDDDVIWGLLFDAALNGFPNPPQGQRQVTTTVQRLPAPAAATTTAAPALATSAPAVSAPRSAAP